MFTLASGPKARAAEPAQASAFTDCPDCPHMVRVPAGTFQMGDATPPAQANERPVHAVAVPAFAAGAYEVTRKQFSAFVAATNYAVTPGCMTDRSQTGRWIFLADASWRDPGLPQTDDAPVVCVDWQDAAAYTAWLSRTTGKSYRLLSEAEWEYAARAGSTTEYWWGNDANDLCAYANGPDTSGKALFPTWRPAQVATCDDGHTMLAPVGSYKPNAFGLYDMAGNAWEWTADCYAPTYDPQPRDGSAFTGGACERRVLRGGSWVYGLGDLRSAQRNGLLPPTIRGADIGFRVARGL